MENQECINCKSFIADKGDGTPGCAKGCIDFPKQLASGQTTTCEEWEIKE